MVSGFTMVPPTEEKRKIKMAKGKTSTKKPAGKQAVQAGPSGGMHKFAGAGTQQPGGTAQANHPGVGAKFASGGPSGKMQKFTPVKPQRPGVTQNTNSGGGGYAKK